MFSAFYFFRDSPERRAALRAEPGSAERYDLFGLDQLARRGAHVRHNLELGRLPGWSRWADRAANRALVLAGGYGGDFATVLASRTAANRADVVFSTVDTVGIPLILLERARLVRPPLVYASIGLPERIVRIRSERMLRRYRDALRRADAVVAYSRSEAQLLRDWLDTSRPAPAVVFVPFGVDTDYFRPAPQAAPEADVVSIGADPRRDFPLLVGVASRRPELSVRIVASEAHARALGGAPANVELETGLPFAAIRDRLAAARVVALPVRDNSYSGATTVLLQAMAMAKPVVIARTAAIAEGYRLEDGVNCRLVPPGDGAALERAIVDLLADGTAAAEVGARARQTVERHLSWERYADALYELLEGVVQRHSRR